MLWPWPLRHRRRRREAVSAERAGPGEASPGAGPRPGADASSAFRLGIPGGTPSPARALCPARAWVLAGLGSCCRHPRFLRLRCGQAPLSSQPSGWVQTCAPSSAGWSCSSPDPGEDAWPGQEWLSGCHGASPRPLKPFSPRRRAGDCCPPELGLNWGCGEGPSSRKLQLQRDDFWNWLIK